MPIPDRQILRAAALMAMLLSPLPGRAQEAGQQIGDAGAYLAARIAAGESDYVAARDWFTRALLADPDNAVMMEGALIAHITLGSFDPAAVLANRMAEVGIASQSANIARLAVQAKAGDFAGLLAAGEDRRISVIVDGLVGAWAELGTGRMSEALQAFDTLAAQPGLEAFGLYNKALALASVGDFEGADAIMVGGEGPDLRLMRRGTVAHIQILSQLERNTDAIAVLDAAFGPAPDPSIAALRARLEAGETLPYDVARNATDGIAEVFFTLSSALNGEAADGYTLVYARVAAFLRPDFAEANLMAAQLLAAQGQNALAVETYALVSEDDPNFHVAEVGRAAALSAEGREDAALEVLQALTRRMPDLMTAHLALGDSLRRAERYAEAIPAYDRAITLIGTPTQPHWIVFYSRAICHEREKNWPMAEADFRKALELEPDQPQVLNYLGYSYVEMGQNLDEALSMIEKAVAARPDSGAITDSLAWALFKLGRFAEAVAPMEAASVLEPLDPVVTDHLGDVYWAVGRKLEAEFQWRRALSFEPAEVDAARIRRKLEVGLDVVRADEGQPPFPTVEMTDTPAVE